MLKLLQLSFEFLKIGACSFGGGLSTLPYMYKLAKTTNWLIEKDITKMITISQITPGPLACNMATYVGYKTSGILGGVMANISFIIPSIIFMRIVYKLLDKFKNSQYIKSILKIIRSSTIAIVLVSSVVIFKIAFFNNENNTDINYKTICLAIILLCIMKKYKISVLKSMVFSGIIGLIFEF